MYYKLFFILLFILPLNVAYSQSDYFKEIKQFQKDYLGEFVNDEDSPLGINDTAFIRFFPINKKFRITTNFTKVIDSIGFKMLTYNHKEKKYFVYGYISFVFNRKNYKLFLYQSEKDKLKESTDSYLFLPFKDNTNYIETYGGGRYLDVRESDIQNGKLIIDFNKCYNPYCAYKGGYSCPIPPKENDLKIKITAGEKLFAKKNEE